MDDKKREGHFGKAKSSDLNEQLSRSNIIGAKK